MLAALEKSRFVERRPDVDDQRLTRVERLLLEPSQAMACVVEAREGSS